MSKRPVKRRVRRTQVTGWALTLIGLALTVGALSARGSWLPAGLRVLVLAGGVVAFSIGLIIVTAGAR